MARRAARDRRRRRLGSRLLLLLAGLVFGLGLGEALVRARRPSGLEGLLHGAPDAMPPEAYMGDDALFQVPRPGWSGRVEGLEYSAALRFNALGLRGGPLAPPQGPRWLLLGDSYALGAQVDEADTLASQLGARWGGELLNAGVDGYSTWQALGRYERLSAEVDVQGALLLFFLGNDLADNLRWQTSPRGRYDPGRPAAGRGLLDRSFLLALFGVKWRAWQLRSGRDPDTAARYAAELAAFTREGGALLDRQLQASRDALVALAAATAARGDALRVLVAPPAFVADPARAAPTFAMAGLEASAADLARPGQRVMALLAELGLQACDLTPALAAAHQQERAWFVFDGHWNPRGHAIAARACW